jgi:hypothetical protein
MHPSCGGAFFTLYKVTRRSRVILTFCRLNESQTAAQFIVTKTSREAPFDAPASVAFSDETVALIFVQTQEPATHSVVRTSVNVFL